MWRWPAPELGPYCAQEHPVWPLPLSGPLARPESEVSGMAWDNDRLMLLPQFPNRLQPAGSQGMAPADGLLYWLPKHRLQAAIDAARQQAAGAAPGARTAARQPSMQHVPPLVPRPLPLIAPELETRFPHFDGFEAIAFAGKHAFVLVETDNAGTPGSFLLHGFIDVRHGALRLDTRHPVRLSLPLKLNNIAFEALTVVGEEVWVFFEVNGGPNAQPQVLRYDFALRPLPALPMPALEYRLTDATAQDARGRFWVTNYHWPKSAWRCRPCHLFGRFGRGPTHRMLPAVERLVALEWDGKRLALAPVEPLQLELDPRGRPRNWEAVARLDDQGFVIMTDRHPESLLAFVPRRPARRRCR
ncbi:MAG: hypothetical protein ACPGUV_01535 [Polyangiales bacterium]